MTKASAFSAQTRYHIIGRIAAGGMAEVYLGQFVGVAGFKRHVAIKRVLPNLVTNRKFVQMLLDESRLGAYINHSNCVSVIDVGKAYDRKLAQDRYFMVMEYVDGPSVRDIESWLRAVGRPFPVALAVLIVREVCLGLRYAHELVDDQGRPLGIVHRDVSPANVLVSRHGDVKLVDFGLAKAANQVERSEADVIKGKFPYLSPEAIRQEGLDGRADVFASGSVLWELLAGQKLFCGERPAQTVKLVERAEYRSLRAIRPDIDQELDELIAQAVSQDRGLRPSAGEMARKLTDWLSRCGQAVCALDLAELVRSYLDARPTRNEEIERSPMGDDVKDQCEHLTSVFDQSPLVRGPAAADPLPLGPAMVQPDPPVGWAAVLWDPDWTQFRWLAVGVVVVVIVAVLLIALRA